MRFLHIRGNPCSNPSSEPVASSKPVTNDSPVQPPACGLGSIKNHLLTNRSVLHPVSHLCAQQNGPSTIAHNFPLLKNSYSVFKTYFKCPTWGVSNFWLVSSPDREEKQTPTFLLLSRFLANHTAVILHVCLPYTTASSLEARLSHQLWSGHRRPSGTLGLNAGSGCMDDHGFSVIVGKCLQSSQSSYKPLLGVSYFLCSLLVPILGLFSGRRKPINVAIRHEHFVYFL